MTDFDGAGDAVTTGMADRDRPLQVVRFRPEAAEPEIGAHLIAGFLATRTLPRPAAVPAVRSSILHADVTAEELFGSAFADEPYAFWLDSACTAYGMGRYSYLGSARGPRRVILRACASSGHVLEETDAGIRREPGSVFDRLRHHLAAVPVSVHTSPVPFTGGYLGYFSRGMIGGGHGEPRHGDVFPDAELMRVDRFVAFDHETGLRHLVTVALSEEDHARWCAEMAEFARRSELPAMDEEPGPARLEHATGRQWITGTTSEHPLSTYGRLRAVNPAPYAAYLRFGERTLLSSSTGRFVTIDADRRVDAKPITGAACRDADPDVDAEAGQVLAEGEKNRSEQLTITDLARTALGRVCEPGSVRVRQPAAVESFAARHQLVTSIRGKLRSDLDSAACVEAAFPDLSPPGAHPGCLGFFGFDGQVDQNLLIHTIVRDGDRFSIGVECPLTASADAELSEARLKANTLLRVLGVDHRSVPGVSGEHSCTM